MPITTSIQSPPQPQLTTTARIDYLDNAKGITAIIVIIYHIAFGFSYRGWQVNVNDTDKLAFADNILYICHLFQMPLFMLIAGYFTAFSFQKYTLSKYLKLRTQRIFLPYIANTIIFLIPQAAFLYAYNNSLSDLLANPTAINIKPDHLWFLHLLIVYTIAMIILRLLFNSIPHTLRLYCNRFASTILSNIFLLLLITSIFSTICLYAWYICPSSVRPLTKIICSNRGFIYLPIFLVGYIAYHHAPLFHALFKRKTTLCVLLALIPFIILQDHWLPKEIINYDHLTFTPPALFYTSLKKWIATLLALTICFRFIHKSNALTKYLAEASFGIYIIHHTFALISIAIVASFGANVPPLMKFILANIICFASTFAIYELIVRRIKIGGFLIVGSPLRKK
ncbi:acyltransferase family protein [Planctomycetota bacterium]|nr:acyltransferase family protein [Planctomycetota bacterium]